MRIAYYISGHGFGHISRSFEVIKFILANSADTKIFACTLRQDFVKTNLKNLFFRKVQTDVGVYQNSSISLDIEKTLEELQNFDKKKNQIYEEELTFLKNEKIDLVISDSSSFPFQISKDLSLRSLFIGNFTWDFIYENYKSNPKFVSFIDTIKEEYSHCTKALILPLSTPVNSLSNIKHVGMIGRKPNVEKSVAKEKFGFDNTKKYFLFSFGAYGFESDFRFDNISDEVRIIVSGYEKLQHKKVINIPEAYYPDLVSACDCVLTKPGYGIVSEAYFASTPILYTDRGDFAEYPFLVEKMKEILDSEFISNSDLVEMKIEEAYRRLIVRKYEKKMFIKEGFQEIFNEIFLLN